MTPNRITPAAMNALIREAGTVRLRFRFVPGDWAAKSNPGREAGGCGCMQSPFAFPWRFPEPGRADLTLRRWPRQLPAVSFLPRTLLAIRSDATRETVPPARVTHGPSQGWVAKGGQLMNRMVPTTVTAP